MDITSCDSSVGGILWNVNGSTEAAVSALAEAIAAVVAERDDVVVEDAVAEDEAAAGALSDAGSTFPAGLEVAYLQ